MARYFFKVFFPNQSAKFMKIPPAFWEHIESESGKRVSLKGPSGSIWKINLIKSSEDGYVFENGWKDFVNDQCLVMGDFLVFCYDGNSRFRVLLFDSSACEKEKAHLVKSSSENEAEFDESSEEGEDDDDEEEENKPLAHLVKKTIEESMKRKRGVTALYGSDSKSSSSKHAHVSPNCGVLLTPKQEVESYATPRYNLSYKNAFTKKNAKSMHRHTAFSFRRTRVNKMINLRYQSGLASGSSPRLDKMSKSKKFSEGIEFVSPDETACRNGSVYRVGSFISRRRHVAEDEVNKTLERALLFKSEYPFVVTVMQESYVYTSFFMCIPSWFVKEHMPKENTKLTVWDPSGKSWEIMYICYNTHGALSGGWSKFSFANNLEKYDCCVFELIQQNELKVHIYRVVEEITPLVRRRIADVKDIQDIF